MQAELLVKVISVRRISVGTYAKPMPELTSLSQQLPNWVPLPE